MSAAGRVAIGFSKPYVADMSDAGGVIAFTNAQILARGVGVSIDVDSSDDNIFYADNQAAESDTGTFTGGSVTLTVDGLFVKAARFLYGWPEADSDGWVQVDDRSKIGNKAIGYIAKYRHDAKDYFVPSILVKTAFNQPGEELNTQEDEIDWQTTELEGRILRADDANHTWRFISETEYETEAAAEAALQTKLNYVAPSYNVTQNLANVTSDYSATSVASGAAITVNLAADADYEISTVAVTVGGVDVTSTTWDSAQSKVTIAAVTGDVVITATATSTGA